MVNIMYRLNDCCSVTASTIIMHGQNKKAFFNMNIHIFSFYLFAEIVDVRFINNERTLNIKCEHFRIS